MNAAFYQGALSVSEVDCKKKKTAFPFWHLIIEKLPRARCVPLHCQNGFLKTGMKTKKKRTKQRALERFQVREPEVSGCAADCT